MGFAPEICAEKLEKISCSKLAKNCPAKKGHHLLWDSKHKSF